MGLRVHVTMGQARERTDMDADELRNMLARLYDRTRHALRQALIALRRLTAPLAAAWARFAIERWERVRAYLADHPDLAEFDAWMDRWYSFGNA